MRLFQPILSVCSFKYIFENTLQNTEVESQIVILYILYRFIYIGILLMFLK